ncbi:hypothetical protein HDV04_004826 [Boothiomyces sp. JEL0838]|nr:hypothetical protein HDV04_004826 [Boothiomyces sp. JEL0838]
MLCIFLQAIVAQNTVVESQWLHSDSCKGPPDSVFIFDVLDLNEYQPQMNETWSSFYNFTVSNGNTVGFCGNFPSYNPNNCCYQSLDTSISGSQGYQSGSPFVLDSNSSTITAFSQQANGYSYCKLDAFQHGSLHGYIEIFYYASNACIDGYFTCSAQKQFYVYSDYGCVGMSSIYSIDTKQEFYDPILGNFSAEFVTIKDGTGTIQWTAMIPWTLLVPNTSSVWDILQHVMFTLTLLGFTFVLTYSVKKYFQKRSINFQIIIVCQVIWLIYTICFMYFQYTSFYSSDTFLEVLELTYTLQNIATLASLFQTAYCFYRVQIKKITKKAMAIYGFIVFVIHIALAGSHYFMVCTYGSGGPLCISVEALNLWTPISFYWYIFVLIWGTLPPLYLTFVVTMNQDSIYKRIKAMYTTDLVYTSYWIIHIGVILLYYCFVYLQFGSPTFSNDRAYNANLAILNFLFSGHAIMSIMVMNRFKIYNGLLKKNCKKLDDGTELKKSPVEKSTVISSAPTTF